MLSPTLFNLFLSDLPIPVTPGVSIDLTIDLPHPCPPSLREYRTSPCVTLFGSPIPSNRTTKILGVTFDCGMTFWHHVAEGNAKGHSWLNVMRAMASTTFGYSKEQQTALYKLFVRPVLEYASPSWTPTSLQRTQISALRITTGCVRSTLIPHLHAESHVLPLLCLPGRRTPLQPPLPLRPGEVCGTRQQPISPQPVPECLDSPSQCLPHAPSNSILGSPPPPINPVEASLPRADRVHLSRLRCGHHPAILTYEARLRPDTDPACRWCQGPPESVPHLFHSSRSAHTASQQLGISGTRPCSVSWERSESFLYPLTYPHMYWGSPPSRRGGEELTTTTPLTILIHSCLLFLQAFLLTSVKLFLILH